VSWPFLFVTSDGHDSFLLTDGLVESEDSQRRIGTSLTINKKAGRNAGFSALLTEVGQQD
jgi:hypothetical protein